MEQVSEPPPRQTAGITDSIQSTKEAPVYVGTSSSVGFKLCSQKRTSTPATAADQQVGLVAKLETDLGATRVVVFSCSLGALTWFHSCPHLQ